MSPESPSELVLRYERRIPQLQLVANCVEDHIRNCLFSNDRRLRGIQFRIASAHEFERDAAAFKDPLRENASQIQCLFDFIGEIDEVVAILKPVFTVLESRSDPLDTKRTYLKVLIPVWATAPIGSNTVEFPKSFEIQISCVETSTIPFPVVGDATQVTKVQVVFLIHGIRTRADWMPMVKRVLSELPNTKVLSIKFGYFDLLRFWCPIGTRSKPIEFVRSQIQIAKARNSADVYSVIAHSFGTYTISKILEDTKDLSLDRLVLCGCIVPKTFPWENFFSRINTDVINDYGTRDIWPVMARILSWGYDDTGRHGFGRVDVRDRGHNFKHSDFFTEDFVRKFWLPWFDDGEYVSSEWEETSPPASWFLNVLSILPLKTILLLLFIGMAWVAYSNGWLSRTSWD